MSYRCQECNSIHSGSENKKITKERNVFYDYYSKKKDFNTHEEFEVLEKSFSGHEIVEEKKLCTACADSLLNVQIVEPPKHVKIVLKYQKRKFIKKEPTDLQNNSRKLNHKNDYEPEEKYT